MAEIPYKNSELSTAYKQSVDTPRETVTQISDRNLEEERRKADAAKQKGVVNAEIKAYIAQTLG